MRRLAPLVLAAAIAVPAGPLRAQDPAPAAAKVDFTKQIAPLLLARCVECHGEKEQKGDLRLDTKAHTLSRADGDPVVVPGKPDDSELLRRVLLPADDDDVMPAKGEPLSKDQQQLLRQWIAEGADWPAAGDEWIAHELAAAVLPRLTFALPALDAAQQSALDAAVVELRRRGALVQRVAADTDALDANLSLLREQVTDADVALLVPLAPRLVWLNLSRSAVTDAAAASLGKLVQLRRLQVANTKLGDTAFAALGALEHLENCNAYGSALGDAGLAQLAKLPALVRVYAWQSKVTPAGAKAAREAAPKLVVDLGDYVDERMAAAQKEAAEIAERRKPVNTVCPVADKPVDLEHVVDHDGRRVAFCCAKCKAAFEKDPAKYVGKLPPKK
jgi:mono/diheme cytochrome c family protein/YHS domain-containing protein